MSGLGLLATAFGSYASTLGGLYKEQVEKEQAAQEKLAAEEREREWERQKMAEERMFAIDMLQRKFEQNVKLVNMENEWRAKNAAIEHQRALERIGYAHKLKLEEKERAFEHEQRRMDYAAQVARRDAMIRGGILGQGGGTQIDPREFSAKVRALTDQLRDIGKRIDNARPEEKPGWIAQYNATKQALDYLLEYGEIPKGLGNAGGTPFIDPRDIINSLANE